MSGTEPAEVTGPRSVRWLVSRCVPASEREFVLGDMEEGFAIRRAERGVWRARVWYTRQALSLLFARWPEPRPQASNGKEHAMSSISADVRFALRSLARVPLFSLLVILTLGVGIGATSALFSVVYPVLLAPPPYPDSDRLMMLSERNRDGMNDGIGWMTFDDTQRETNVFSSLAAMSYWQPTIQSGNTVLRLSGQRVSHTFFATLGVKPALGRDFRPEEDRLETRRVAILSDGLWRRLFGADSSIVGRTAQINGSDYLIAGVLPSSFQSLLFPQAELWSPLGYDANGDSSCRTCHHLRVIGRLRAGLPQAAARAQLDAYFATLRARYPDQYGSVGALLRSLSDEVSGTVRPALLALFAAVGLLLLLACANVANLFLGRTGERHTELSVRRALGAERMRLVRLVSIEPLLLAFFGGVLGVFGSWAGTRLLVDFLQIPPALATRVSTVTPVIAFALLAATLSALLSGTLPALVALRDAALADIRMGTRTRVGARHRLRGIVVVAEMALAVTLMVGAGLQVRSLQQTLKVTTGYQADGVFTTELGVTGPRYNEDGTARRYFQQVLDQGGALPAVQSLAIVSQLPLGGNFDGWGIHREDRPGNPERDPEAQRFAVSWQYLDVMGIPVLRGRGFTAADRAGAAPVVLFNEVAVRTVFGGENPIGKRVRVGGTDSPWREVIGVVGNVRHLSLEHEIESQFYMPYDQTSYEESDYVLVARTNSNVASLAEPIAQVARTLDPGAVIARPRPMSDVVAEAMQARRLAGSLVGAFAVIALLLASGGLYGVMAASVIERRREMGLRTALGATPLSVVRLVITRGFVLTLLGGLIGGAGVLAAQRSLQQFVFGVTPADPITLTAVIVTLAMVAMIACLVPAWRAARADPVIMLRES
jgi:putative ABC transport system permease protein